MGDYSYLKCYQICQNSGCLTARRLLPLGGALAGVVATTSTITSATTASLSTVVGTTTSIVSTVTSTITDALGTVLNLGSGCCATLSTGESCFVDYDDANLATLPTILNDKTIIDKFDLVLTNGCIVNTLTNTNSIAE